MTTQKWYKSKVFWASLISLIGIIVIAEFGLEPSIWTQIATALLGLLSVFGLANSPSVKNGLSAGEEKDEDDDI